MMQFLFLYLYKRDHGDIFDDLTCIYHRRMMIAVVRDIVCEGDGKENGTNGLEKKKSPRGTAGRRSTDTCVAAHSRESRIGRNLDESGKRVRV